MKRRDLSEHTQESQSSAVKHEVEGAIFAMRCVPSGSAKGRGGVVETRFPKKFPIGLKGHVAEVGFCFIALRTEGLMSLQQ